MVSRARDIVLVRHPETSANVEGRYVGRGDASLTPRGIEQIPLLVAAIQTFDPEAIHTSPLARTRTVADTAAALLGVPEVVDDRLTELDFGLAEGLTFEETRSRGITFEFKSEDRPVAPEGESRLDIMRRTAEVLDEIVAGERARVAIVTHGGVFRSALVHLLGLPLSAIWAFDIRNGCTAEVRVREGHGQLIRFENVG
ncbi:MAG: histidine phosphatase family protein [Coriobacteriia bacterium]|nr:histidine phosphatase family protein [Coriobacteriia bacterium]